MLKSKRIKRWFLRWRHVSPDMSQGSNIFNFELDLTRSSSYDNASMMVLLSKLKSRKDTNAIDRHA